MAEAAPAAPAAPAASAAAPAAPAAAPAPATPASSTPAAPANPFAAPSPAATPAAATPPSGTYWPDKLPDHLRGGSDRETLDKLFGAYSGLRTEMAQRGAVPKDPAGYKLELPADIAKAFGDITKDPSAQIFRTLAHKHGLTDKQAQGMFAEFNGEVLKAGLVKTTDPKVEARTLAGPRASTMSEAEVLDAAGKRWNDVMGQVDVLTSGKRLTSEQAQAIKAGLGETAAGIVALEALLAVGGGERGIQTGGQAGVLTRGDLDRMANDERNDPRSPKFDAAFSRQVMQSFQTFFGAAGPG